MRLIQKAAVKLVKLYAVTYNVKYVAKSDMAQGQWVKRTDQFMAFDEHRARQMFRRETAKLPRCIIGTHVTTSEVKR